jgi:peptidoglycan hydrolase-like protein with peptidoglycan-binding domain
MGTLCGGASIDERGSARGGTVGDQTGKEVKTLNWYDFGQTVVLRFKDRSKAKKAAASMKALCNGNLVGYDQNQRTTLYTALQAVNWDISKLNTKCETDCSAMMSPVLKTAGISVSKDIYTGNMVKAIMSTGEFEKLTASKYTDTGNYLLTGDIMVNEGRHTIMALEDGSKASGETASAEKTTSSGTQPSGFKSNVRDFQKWLNDNFSAGLAEDNSFGILTRRAAVKAWQQTANNSFGAGLAVDGAFGTRSKSFGSRACVKKGSRGTFVYIVQGMLRAKGYYKDDLDGEAGSSTDTAIRAYQSAKGLSADGQCGSNTWYSLFN